MTAAKKLPVLPDVAYQGPAEPQDVCVTVEGNNPDAPFDRDLLPDAIVERIREVYDPEIPVNVYDLGLIYDIAVDVKGTAMVKMTLTAPACPVAGMLVQQVAEKAASVDGVKFASVELVWDPPWTRERMTEAAQLELGLI